MYATLLVVTLLSVSGLNAFYINDGEVSILPVPPQRPVPEVVPPVPIPENLPIIEAEDPCVEYDPVVPLPEPDVPQIQPIPPIAIIPEAEKPQIPQPPIQVPEQVLPEPEYDPCEELHVLPELPEKEVEVEVLPPRPPPGIIRPPGGPRI